MKIFYEINKNDTREHILEFNRYIEKKFPQLLTEENPNLVICTGGDGTYLKTLSKWGKKGIPVLGRAAGTINFLLNDFDNTERILNGLIKNELKLDYIEASVIEVYLNGTQLNKSAINDIVIGNGIMDWQKFRINTEDNYLKDFKFEGLGICISTPVGSTGFNYNNHGKILRFENNKKNHSDLWSFTSVVANARLNEVMFEQNIDVDILTDRHQCFLFIDGEEGKIELSFGDKVSLKNGEKYKMAFLDKQLFIQKRIDLDNRKKKWM